jgi:hypothetical protein
LINTNKSAIVAKVKNFRELNTPQTNYVQSQTECCYYLQQWWQYYRQRFRYLFLSSSITRSKRESFLQKDLEEREYSNLGCVYLLQQQDLKERILSANGSLLALKMDLLYRYSVGGRYSTVGDPFCVWVSLWVTCWRQSKLKGQGVRAGLHEFS